MGRLEVKTARTGPETPRGLARTLVVIIALSLFVHVACLVAGRTFMEDWRFPHHPVHAAVEMAGGLIALLVAWMLLALERRGAGTSANVWIAGALIGMGLLDGMHALVHEGQAFVWLHSTATFIGGLLFLFLWTPPVWQDRVARWWPWAVLAGTLAFGGASLLRPEWTPPMLVLDEAGERVFGMWAQCLNVAGGLLLFAAAVRLVLLYRANRNVDDLLFCLHCSLFGAAAVMFEESQLWDAPWWGWHLLRLQAYGVALWFVVRTELQEQAALAELAATLRSSSDELERRVTERTEELAASKRALEQSNIELKQFAYVASHDLQSPLRTVSLVAEVVREDYADSLDAEGRRALDRIVAGCRRMHELIRDLLQYSRVDSRARPFEPTSLNEVVDDAVEVLASSIADSGGEVTRGDLPIVKGDRSQLCQLLQNLIGNGLKYHGDRRPHVHVSAEVEGDAWRIAVTDNGIGIDPRYHEQIFELFRRLHTQEEYPGTGIGLAVSQRIVKRHGGRLSVSSAVGEGSAFAFSLPRDGGDSAR